MTKFGTSETDIVTDIGSTLIMIVSCFVWRSKFNTYLPSTTYYITLYIHVVGTYIRSSIFTIDVRKQTQLHNLSYQVKSSHNSKIGPKCCHIASLGHNVLITHHGCVLDIYFWHRYDHIHLKIIIYTWRCGISIETTTCSGKSHIYIYNIHVHDVYIYVHV